MTYNEFLYFYSLYERFYNFRAAHLQYFNHLRLSTDSHLPSVIHLLLLVPMNRTFTEKGEALIDTQFPLCNVINSGPSVTISSALHLLYSPPQQRDEIIRQTKLNITQEGAPPLSRPPPSTSPLSYTLSLASLCLYWHAFSTKNSTNI